MDTETAQRMTDTMINGGDMEFFRRNLESFTHFLVEQAQGTLELEGVDPELAEGIITLLSKAHLFYGAQNFMEFVMFNEMTEGLDFVEQAD
jgi:hypothetical protein